MASGEPSGAQITVLAVAPEPDRVALRRILEHSRWTLVEAETIAQAMVIVNDSGALVLICEAVLPDGTWEELLDLIGGAPTPPPLIVTARQADDDLWMHVLNRGGYNLLGKPFSEREVFEMVSVAWRHRKDRATASLRAVG